MKLQYRYIDAGGFRYIIRLYCDGWLVKSYKIWLDELDNEIEKIENQGYTYGYTEDELDRARAHYKNVLDNVIKKESDLYELN